MTQKILIIRFSSIGDIVLTTPIIRCIKIQKGVELHFLTKRKFKDVLQQNPYIDYTHYLVDDHKKELINDLKKQNFDYIVDLQKNLNSKYISSVLGKKYITFDKQNINKWLLVNFKINRLPKKHLVDRYFDSIQSLGVKDDGLGTDFFIDQSKLSRSILNFEHKSYRVLVLGANYFTKRIPSEKCVELIQNNAEIKMVLIGGKDVEDVASELTNQFSNVINMVGNSSLNESAFLIKHAELIYTGDTGMMHFAAALQKIIVVIWGNTTPTFGMYPYYGKNNSDKHISIENNNLSCRPCSKLGYNQCPKGHFKCMMEINLRDV